MAALARSRLTATASAETSSRVSVRAARSPKDSVSCSISSCRALRPAGPITERLDRAVAPYPAAVGGWSTAVEEQLEKEREAVASRPQHLLLTLLGDHWFPRREDLPSAALVSLLAEFGVSETNARAALSRLGRRGLLVSHREGRRTNYGVTPEGMRALDAGTEQIFTFATVAPAWDGQWTLVAFSVPEEQRTVRTSLRARLGWLGFAAVFDAVWAAPGDREEDAAALLGECGVESATVVVGRASRLVPGGNPVSAWNLDELRARYEGFLERFAPLRKPVEAGSLTPAQALTARTAVIDVWREFPGVDPQLPAELLPAQWPQRAARELFGELYDALAEPATSRVREVVAGASPERAELVAFHTTDNALELLSVPTR